MTLTQPIKEKTMTAQKKAAALFVSLECYDFGIEGPTVLRFETEAEAWEFVFRTLVKNGELIVDDDGSIWDKNHEWDLGNRSLAIGYWQDGLGASEYFHVYDCKDATADDAGVELKLHEPEPI